MISLRTILSAARDMWWAKRGGTQALMERQQTRLQMLLDFARAYSPFYQRRYRSLPARIDQLTDLPPVTKRDLMTLFDEWVTDPEVSYDSVSAFIADPTLIGTPYLGRYAVWHTSGTTGSPGIFLHDATVISTYIALLMTRCYLSWTTARDFWELAQRHWQAAFIFATGGHFASNTFEAITHQLRPGSSQTPAIFPAQMALPDLVHALNAGQPAILAMYLSVLATLTREQAAGRLKIKPLLIATGGECLRPLVREQAANAFQCGVHDAYAASEFMGIAFDCEHGRLHLNNDWVILEPVDAEYRSLAPGSHPHTVLLTNLVNRVQPIIRYEMGDSVRLEIDACPCGSPLPTIAVEGRDDETLTFETAEGRRVDISPLPLATVVEEVSGVQRFQLIRTSATTLSVRLEVAPNIDEAQVWQSVAQGLEDYLLSQGLASIRIERSADPPCQQVGSGKFRHIWTERQSIRAVAGGHQE